MRVQRRTDVLKGLLCIALDKIEQMLYYYIEPTGVEKIKERGF